ncbi:MAG: hypothetical protein ABI388_02175 [Bacteroidia bacterium]
MIKTSTLNQNTSSLKTKQTKQTEAATDDFGPSDFTIQNILNYSKALQVISLGGKRDPIFSVMN